MKMKTTVRAAALGAVAAMALSLPSSLQAEPEQKTSLERVNGAEKGKLKNPLAITPEIIAEGKGLYQSKTCGACHGGNGGGIHCPSLINDAWIYGKDDDTLFRLITLGSSGLEAAGYSRSDAEKHAGPMPSFAEAIPNEQDIWKIIAYIRSLETRSPIE
jgi:mono/diheme cytochrome c family protein